jgi:undecaprenyl-diphosphatase
MSAVGVAGAGAGLLRAWRRRVDANVRATIATLLRAPRTAIAWPSRNRAALAAAVAVAAVVVIMLVLDHPALSFGQRLPRAAVDALDRFSDFGKSGWFLWPLGIVLVGLSHLDLPALPRFWRGVLATWAVRLGFVFLAVGLPGLFVSIVKRLIGRARPLVEGNDVWAYHPFAWQVDYASLPSGHATTAFSALVALGAIFPPARALLWIYALLIALSRVAVTAHYPSDVLAGAIVGALGALLVRNWFAARGLGFIVGRDGKVRPLPGPSGRRIVKAVARGLRSA